MAQCASLIAPTCSGHLGGFALYDVQIAKLDLGKILDRIETVNKPKAA